MVINEESGGVVILITFRKITFKSIFLLAVLFSITGKVSAKDVSLPSEYMSGFFLSLSKDYSDSAIDMLIDSNSILHKEKVQIDTLKSKLSSYSLEYGGYDFHELVCKNKIGDNLVTYTYLVGYEYSAVVFDFLFFKSKSRWKIKSIETSPINIDLINNRLDRCKSYN
ncbi:hypothetical protein [Vibrio splendidus]|uniref:hypothetical protein n=1 Tax=Vibrio splendidus TaxID=29497 RepID=UPI000E328FF5|nr:hypothetical protein [Vibrio splendidus]